MMRLQKEQQKNSHDSGASMLLVVLLLMVFFILGAAVLTAASSAAAAPAARAADRQAYYYARSTLDAVDASLRQTDEGSLGRMVLEKGLSALKANGGDSVELDETLETQGQPGMLTGALAGVTVEKVSLHCQGRAEAVSGAGSALTEGFVQLRQADLTVVTSYRERTYTLRVRYRFSGSAVRTGADTADWRYEGAWTVLKMG